MSVATVAEVLERHTTLALESIDRLYLNLYQPRLQTPGMVVGFLRGHRGHRVASSVLLKPMTDAFVANVHSFCDLHRLPWVDFRRGERKDDVAGRHFARFDGEDGVVFVGRAQERASVFRTRKRRNPQTGQTYPWMSRESALPNAFYFYLHDRDFGPLFVEFCSYFPFTGRVCLNAHEYVKRQLAREGVPYQPSDNGLAWCADPARAQAIAEGLGPAAIRGLVDKWLGILPDPFTDDDRAAGYRYDLSVLQAEFSLTQVLDRPLAGRSFFDGVIRDHLDLGRPDQVGLIFDRRVTRRTPGRWRTRVVTRGVTPCLDVAYKHTKIKQYHKEGVALRTETTINDTRDFGIGKRLDNLPALRQVSFSANRRLLAVQTTSCDPIVADRLYSQVTQPQVVAGQRVSALRFDDPRVQALLATPVMFTGLGGGFTNRDLRPLLALQLGVDPATITAGKMTYDLRRLRLHGIIERLPGTHRYRVTDDGLAVAVFFTRTHRRLLRPGLAQLIDHTHDGPLKQALRRLDQALADLADHARLPAAA